ncbi:inositol monophosphatase family protein [Dictyoglomus sp.]|uniref:inositol monophosphatase family protein n=1 Tax=Dictyoglomus sp. TaxID=28205 RepID=UPI003D0D5459
MKRILEVAIKTIKESGNILLNYIGEEKEIELKGISNLVTQVDKLSERHILKSIEENFPDHSILTEETGFINKNSEYTWIVDPLDGTTNYAHNFPFFGISIALIKNKEIILGLIYDPIRDELFYAIKNEGAYLNDRRIEVSKTESLKNSLISFAFPYELSLEEKNFIPFINFSSRTHGIRRTGSAAIEIAYVGCGRLDGFWAKKLKPWDISAGILIVEEAKGKVTDFSGNNIDIHTDNILFSNGKIHQEMIKILNLGKIFIRNRNEKF